MLVQCLPSKVLITACRLTFNGPAAQSNFFSIATMTATPSEFDCERLPEFAGRGSAYALPPRTSSCVSI
jgi:hypothetical protein